MGTARTIVVLLLVAASSLWFNPSVAGADCAGPTIDHQGGEVSPGSTVVVEGLWWGDNCYDTGPPPDTGVEPPQNIPRVRKTTALLPSRLPFRINRASRYRVHMFLF